KTSVSFGWFQHVLLREQVLLVLLLLLHRQLLKLREQVLLVLLLLLYRQLLTIREQVLLVLLLLLYRQLLAIREQVLLVLLLLLHRQVLAITGTDSASPPTQPPPTENPEAGPCDVNPCGIGSTCDPRHNQTFVCLCLAGDVYNYDNTICERAKVFPGHLSLPGINYNNEMADKTSEIFLDNSKAITDALSAELNKTEGYSGSIVLEIRPINNGKVWLRNSKGVNATVEITYAPSADIKTEEVLTAIKIGATCSDCTLKGSTFVDENLCDNSPCDEKSVTCSSADGDFNCTCIENYIKTDFSNRICIACPSGTKADESSECVA
uniref:Uncharacterized protein n=1 Tax=Dicentrarchus labrax TaxID=13489 RepID=A0A8C4H151_DICLA